MDVYGYIDKLNRAEDRARKFPNSLIRFERGLYVMFAGGKLHWIEHVSPSDGFARDEWTVSTGDDLHHDQHRTLTDAKVATIESSRVKE